MAKNIFILYEIDDFDWARGPLNLYVGQCIRDVMDPSETEWVVEKIGTTIGDREVVYVNDGEETIMLDRKIAEEDLNNGRYVSCDSNFIVESDEWDWAREIPANPLQWHKPKINLDNVERDEQGYPLQQGFGEGEIWVDVDGLTKDQKITVLKIIESIIGELTFENSFTTIKDIENNKIHDFCLGNGIKGYIIHCGHERYDFFSQENHVCCMFGDYQSSMEGDEIVQIEIPRIYGKDLLKIA